MERARGGKMKYKELSATVLAENYILHIQWVLSDPAMSTDVIHSFLHFNKKCINKEERVRHLPGQVGAVLSPPC